MAVQPNSGAVLYTLAWALVALIGKIPILDSFGIFGPSMALFGDRGGSEMIVSHRLPSSPSMSSYRAIWIHLKPNAMNFINLILQTHFKWLASGIGLRKIQDRLAIDSR